MGRVQRRSGKEIGVLGRGRLDSGVYQWLVQDGEGVEARGVWGVVCRGIDTKLCSAHPVVGAAEREQGRATGGHARDPAA